MPKKFLKSLWKDEKGITGLETAIILIAFVVVAAVFAYTVLSAGLFATQKSQEAVYSGLKEAQSTMELKGGVIAYKGDATISSSVGKVQFTISNALNGEAIDLTPPYSLSGDAPVSSGLTNPTTIAYTDTSVTVATTAWTLDWVGKHTSDYLLENNEKAIITVWLHSYNGTAWSDGGIPPFLGSNYVDAYHTFTLEVKPPKGAVLNIQRTMPAIIRDVTNLN